MTGIFIPPQLAKLDSAFELLSLLRDLNDPEVKKQIYSDIESFHKLSETEAEKLREAMATIATHEKVLAEVKNLAEKNKQDAFSLDEEKVVFENYKKQEYSKLQEAKEAFTKDVSSNKAFYEQILEMQKNVASREDALIDGQTAHAGNLLEFESQKEKFESEKKELEILKAQVTKKLGDYEAKTEALKKIVL